MERYSTYSAASLCKNVQNSEILEAVTAMNIQVEVFQIVTPRSVVVRYQRFGGAFCLHLQGVGGVVLWWDTNVSEELSALIFRVWLV